MLSNDDSRLSSLSSLLVCAQQAILSGAVPDSDVINVIDIALDLAASELSTSSSSIDDCSDLYNSNLLRSPAGDNDLLSHKEKSNSKPLLSIGRRIYHSRKDAGKTQAIIADATGVSIQAVSLWEKNLTTPDCDKIIPLANALKCDPLWLLSGETK